MQKEEVLTKKTAIEWLFTSLIEGGYLGAYVTPNDFEEEKIKVQLIIARAIGMEKDQIIDAYDYGFSDAWDIAVNENESTFEDAEDYFFKNYENFEGGKK